MIRKYLNTVFLGISIILGFTLSIPAATTLYTTGSHFDVLEYLFMAVFFSFSLAASLCLLFGFFTDGNKHSRYMSLGSAISFFSYLLYYESSSDLIFPQTLKEWHWTIFRFSLVTWMGAYLFGAVLMEIKSKITRKDVA